MLIFLLFSDQISGEGLKSLMGARTNCPPPPVEEARIKTVSFKFQVASINLTFISPCKKSVRLQYKRKWRTHGCSDGPVNVHEQLSLVGQYEKVNRTLHRASGLFTRSYFFCCDRISIN